MKSHVVEFEPKDLACWVGGPVLVAVSIAVVLHLGAAWRLLPGPRPSLDTDRTVIVHQVEASRDRRGADILLLGDSSCLMDVDARQVGAAAGRRVLNLGLNSYLDLAAYRLLLGEFTAANPGRPRAIVLLMHPEALRRVSSEPYQLAVLNHYLAGTDPCGPQVGRLECWSGAELFRNRILSRLLPSALGGGFGRYYGFSVDLERYMSAHDGSAIDPGNEPALGNAEYRLSPTLEKMSGDFRGAVPKGTTVMIGITPVPSRFARGKYPGRRDEMLRQWGRWLGVDEAALLYELPAVLPDELFTGVTHLKPAAVPVFSEMLARALKARLP